jgi:hypothetical protein
MPARRLVGLAALALAACTLSCASGPRLYVNPDADMGFYKKVAVFPFTNISGDGMAAQRVTRAFVTELLMTDRFQVVQPEDFVGSLARTGVFPGNDGTYDPDKLKEFAAGQGIQGILRGAVTEYQMTRNESGDVPSLAFDAEMLDVNTGTVVWRASITRRGHSRMPIIGSGGSRSLARLTEEACQELVGRLRKGAL